MRYTDAIKRGGESIGRWCRRYLGTGRRDERRLHDSINASDSARILSHSSSKSSSTNARDTRQRQIDFGATGWSTPGSCRMPSSVPIISRNRLRLVRTDTKGGSSFARSRSSAEATPLPAVCCRIASTAVPFVEIHDPSALFLRTEGRCTTCEIEPVNRWYRLDL